MTDRDDILLLLGEIKGQIAGFFLRQAAQDTRLESHDERMDRIEDAHAGLMWKVAGIVGLLEALGIGALHFVKG